MPDYYDIHPVKVAFPVDKDEDEERIEKMMLEVSNNYERLMELQFYCCKLNLENPKDETYNKQVRTYFQNQYSWQRTNPLYRYDINYQLRHVGDCTRLGTCKYKYTLFDEHKPYTPAPKFAEVVGKAPSRAKAYKIKMPEINIIPSHPFKESQMKFTYAHTNDYTVCLKKNEKISLGGREIKFKLHGIDESYDGMLVRFVTPDTAHYFKCEKPGQGKSGHWSVFTIEHGWMKKWSPKKHLPKLKEITM